jgi:hypothetical protein
MEPRWIDIDGVPTVWAEAPGPLTARLMFRVGKADETLVRGGVTHLAEHLALHALGQQPHYQNGSVRTSITTFDISGDDETVADFLGGLCRALHDLPLERMTSEVQVLGAEAARRGSGAYTTALAWRYGPNGPGLWNYDEYAGITVGAQDVQSWAHEVFTRDNAVLVLTGPPPAQLALPLPSGRRREAPALADVLGASPAWFEHPFADVSALGSLERSCAAAVYVHALQHELTRRLRFDRAIAYSPSVDYDPYDGSTALISVLADSHPDRVAEVATEVSDIIERLADTGPEQERLDEYRVQRARDREVPGYLAGRAHQAAFDRLMTGELPVPWEEELAQLELADVTAAAVLARASILYGLPADVQLPEGRAVPAPQWSTTPPLEGQVYRPIEASDVRLTLGMEGTTLDVGEGRTATVRYDECRAALAWPDGKRVLIAPDGVSISIEPHLWSGGDAVVRYLDARTAHVRVAQPPRATDDIPPEPPIPPRPADPAERGATIQIVLGAVLALTGFARTTGSSANGGPALGLLVAAAGIFWIVVGWRRLRRSGRHR